MQSNLLPGLIKLDACPFVDISSNHANEKIKSELLIAVLDAVIVDMEVVDFSWIGETPGANLQGAILNLTQPRSGKEINIYIRENAVKEDWKVAKNSQGKWELEAGLFKNEGLCAAKIDDSFCLWKIFPNKEGNKYKLDLVAKGSTDTLGGVYAVQFLKNWDGQTFSIKNESPLSNWNTVYQYIIPEYAGGA